MNTIENRLHRGDVVAIKNTAETHVVFTLYAHGDNPPDAADTLSLLGEGKNRYIAPLSGGGIPVSHLDPTGESFTLEELRELYLRGAEIAGLGMNFSEYLWEIMPPEIIKKP